MKTRRVECRGYGNPPRDLAAVCSLRSQGLRLVIKRISETSRISTLAQIAARFRLVRLRRTNRLYSPFTLGFDLGTHAAINSLECEGIRNEAGRSRFVLSAKNLIDATGVKGLIATAGRYGGTYAHKEVAS